MQLLLVHHNQLSGAQVNLHLHSSPAGLARQEELELLLVDHNQLSGVLPTYWDAPQLTRLDLQHNNFSGEGRCIGH